MKRKKVSLKIMSMVVSVMCITSISTVATIGISKGYEVNAAENTPVSDDSDDFANQWVSITKKIGMKYVGSLLNKVPAVGDLLSISYNEVLSSLFASKDSVNQDLDKMKSELINLNNSIYELTKLEEYKSDASELDGLSKDINGICEKMADRLKNIVDAEKNGNKTLVTQYKDIILSGDKGAKDLYLKIDKMSKYLLGKSGVQQRDVMKAYYNYCKAMASNVFGVQAIAESSTYEEALLKTYGNAVSFEIIYEKLVAEKNTNNEAIQKDCLDTINQCVSNYNLVIDNYKKFKKEQYNERLNYIKDAKNPVKISGIGTKTYESTEEKDTSDDNIPDDAINIDKSNEIIKGFNGTTTLREYLKSKGYDIPSNVKKFIASKAEYTFTGPHKYCSISIHQRTIKVYDLDSNSANTNSECIYSRVYDPGFFGIGKTNEKTNKSVLVAYFKK